MFAPPSLPADVRARAFHARNGEFGIRPEDASAFLDACVRDGATVLGWEAWIVDHLPDFSTNTPVPAPGRWGGLVPLEGRTLLAVLGGSGDAEATRAQLAEFTLDDVQPAWRAHVRVNFTLAAEARPEASA